jgi:CxxC motif-containing protein (DUF1111 family)
VATLTDFTADAFIYEQGITNPPDETEEETNFGHELPAGVDPAPDPEISEEDVNLTVAFVQLLAPPTRPILFDEANSGRAVFEAIGCATCHVPELTTGSHPLPSLRNRTFFAYTDPLLHDMGPDLADICNGSATPSEFRTEPLMGLSLATTFLHDGRARSIEEAIVAHGGEAAGARDRFLALTSGARSSLMTFLRSL